jgi:hypothetical protein
MILVVLIFLYISRRPVAAAFGFSFGILSVKKRNGRWPLEGKSIPT